MTTKAFSILLMTTLVLGVALGGAFAGGFALGRSGEAVQPPESQSLRPPTAGQAAGRARAATGARGIWGCCRSDWGWSRNRKALLMPPRTVPQAGKALTGQRLQPTAPPTEDRTPAVFKNYSALFPAYRATWSRWNHPADRGRQQFLKPRLSKSE